MECVYYIKENNKLPNIVNIANIEIDYLDTFSLDNSKRFNLLNINKNDIIKFFNENCDNKIDKKNNIFKNTNLFINIILRGINEKIGHIFINEEEAKIENFTKNEKEYTKHFYNYIIPYMKNNKDIDDDFLDALEDYKKKKIYKSITRKFQNIPYFYKYYNIAPDIDEFRFIEKLCYLSCLIDLNELDEEDGENETDLEDNEVKENIKKNNFIILKRFDYLKKNTMQKINKDEDFSIKDKIFILINIYSFVKQYSHCVEHNYELIKMKELPVHSPYVQSEILYRTIIAKLKKNSKLTFLLLQLNSGGGYEFFSNKTWYKIKMIPLIAIKMHILNDYYPYFFIYNMSNISMSNNNIYTNIKSFNEYYFKTLVNNFSKEDSIRQKKSVDKTVKFCFLKFHEDGHSKYNGNFRLEKSPRFLLKNDLSTLVNDFNKIKKIRAGKIIITYDKNGEEIYEGNFTPTNYGESGHSFGYYLFRDYKLFDSFLKNGYNLDEFLDFNLYIDDNLDKFNELVRKKLMKKKKKKKKSEEFIKNIKYKKSNIHLKKIPKLELGKNIYRNITYYELGQLMND